MLVHVMIGVMRNESVVVSFKTLPENGTESETVTLAPAGTSKGTAIVMFVSSRPSGKPVPGPSD